MELQVTKEAAMWYKVEMELSKGEKIRFYVRYGGHSQLQRGFSLGIDREEPFDIGAQTTVEGITFYIEERDLWYFDGHDIRISIDPNLNEPVFEAIE